MRQAYQGTGKLFDLALVEATRPDGQRQVVEWKGRAVEAMTPAYTDDGGHLNAEGRRRVASALVTFLAALPPGAGR
jgi:lysophospholipase L1-like esterase